MLTLSQVVKQRFEEAQLQSSPSELLHIATLAQEAYLLFVTETLRFKSPAVVKANKFNNVSEQNVLIRF